MRALVVYESMYGNTHEIAAAIGDGLRNRYDVDVVAVGGAHPDLVRAADLLVVGGPTHGHSVSTESSRHQAVDDAAKPERNLELDDDAMGPGLRDWIPTVSAGPTGFVAFDTRVDIAALLSGRASKAISRLLRHHGLTESAPPESFLVTRHNQLVAGEAERACTWAQRLADELVPTA